MKLLLDENLSFRLIGDLQLKYPGSTHVDLVGLRGADDSTLWALAQRNGFALVSKDDDFRQLSLLHGPPPKVILLACGNAGNTAILDLLASHADRMAAFESDADESLLVLQFKLPPTE